MWQTTAPGNTADGSEKWSYATGDGVASSPTLSADGTTLYIGSADKNVYALNTADGSKKWSYATGGEIYSSSTLSADGTTLYIGSDVYALNTGL